MNWLNYPTGQCNTDGATTYYQQKLAAIQMQTGVRCFSRANVFVLISPSILSLHLLVCTHTRKQSYFRTKAKLSHALCHFEDILLPSCVVRVLQCVIEFVSTYAFLRYFQPQTRQCILLFFCHVDIIFLYILFPLRNHAPLWYLRFGVLATHRRQ